MATISDADLRSVIYSPLDYTRSEVRFIEIMPSTTNDQWVSCRLKTMELAEDVRYAALSYVWGDANTTDDIVVNGINLPVTANLASALEHIRKNGLPYNKGIGKLHHLWVDAICINQDDVQEKNNQVPLMGKLYANASAVLSWLGTPDSKQLDKALQIIHDIAPVIGATPDGPGDGRSDELTRAGFEWLNSTLGPSTGFDARRMSPKWQPLAFLRDSPYWGRVWVIQEMVLAKSHWAHWFVCGDASATFAEVYKYHHFMGGIGETIFPAVDGYRAVSPDQALWKEFTKTMSELRGIDMVVALGKLIRPPDDEPMLPVFEVAITIATYCSATLPHDFIYALLGIVPQYNIKMDYTKPVKEVYLDAIAASLNKTWLYLDLSGHGFNATNEHGLPSWVPDLTQLSRVGFRDAREKRGPPFNIETLPPPQIAASGALRIHGALCAHVELVKRIDFRSDNHYSNEKALYQLCVDYLVEFFGVCEALAVVKELEITAHGYRGRLESSWGPGEMAGKVAGRRPLQVLFDVLDWKRKDSRNKIQTFFGLSGLSLSPMAWAFFHLLWQYDGLTQEDEECAKTRLRASNLGKFMATMFADYSVFSMNAEEIDHEGIAASRVELEMFVSELRKTTLFKTDIGLLGIGPPGMGPGDLVCVVQGHGLPVLLREVKEPDGGSHLEHVGCCYVLGLSNGEPAEVVKNGRLKIQEFMIL
ncbi:heterokaryon incompatibility protein-domain-containing protein [Nemania abortiva]|nr:heterokaryon incompatibility protein-domain-containing protein [Nemania abortiva]